jgi:spore coat protein U-like protein
MQHRSLFSGSCNLPDDHHHYLGWAIASNVNFTFVGMLLDTYSSYNITPPAQSVSYVIATTLCSLIGIMVLHKLWSSERSVVLQSQFYWVYMWSEKLIMCYENIISTCNLTQNIISTCPSHTEYNLHLPISHRISSPLAISHRISFILAHLTQNIISTCPSHTKYNLHLPSHTEYHLHLSISHRISSLLAHLTQKLIAYYLFLSRRNIISPDSRNAEQTNLSFSCHGNYVTVFDLHFRSTGSVGTFRAVLSR